jgi:predicted kinase
LRAGAGRSRFFCSDIGWHAAGMGSASEGDTTTPLRAGCLIVIGGLPGSGKSTISLELATERRGVRLSPDEWMATLDINLWDEVARERVETLQWALAQELLQVGAVVIIEWGSWARAERDSLRERARQLGARVELRFLDVPIDELWSRIQERGFEDPPIQRSDLEQWASQFEGPDEVELAMFDVSAPAEPTT